MANRHPDAVVVPDALVPEPVDPGLDHASTAAEMRQLLLNTEDITGFLDEAARFAVTIVGPAALSCGITLGYNGRDAAASAFEHEHNTGQPRLRMRSSSE
jgi:hypothetical protein